MSYLERFLSIQPIFYALILVFIFPYWAFLNFKKRKTDTKWNDLKSATNWVIAKGLAPIIFYIILSSYFGQWDRFLNGVFLAMTSLGFFVMSTYELGCGIAIKTNVDVDEYKIKKISLFANMGVIASTSLAILIFQKGEVSVFLFSVQAAVLICSVIMFFVVSSITNFFGLSKNKQIVILSCVHR